jgi:type VI secretion system protein ImpL
VLWGLLVLLFRLRSKRKNEKLVEEVAKGAAGDPGASAEEAAALARRFQEALAQLKASRLGGARRSWLYQLPWYIVIGPPGAGKTTALVNSGLKFPLEGTAGKGKLQGVGGTRDCDWWFTEDAVLIDTAGRYTTQDSDQPVDTAGWKAFLGLLRRYRPRQPINGVLVAISLSDLMTADEAERAAHAHAVRQRIRELYDELKARFPIYVLFTKADLVAGFVEYFEDLDQQQRDQVWGMTFPLSQDKRAEPAVAGFPAEFDGLVARLNERVLERLQQERDVSRRVVALGFPTQVGALKQVAQAFLDEVFQPSRYAEPPLLRGVYFTSGTQEGTPVDRVMSAMAATFGLNPQRLSAQSGRGRSYFLGRLLREVIFREAGLVSVNRRAERRRRLVFGGVAAVALLVLLAGIGAWFTSYSNNQSLIAAVETSIASYRQQVESLDLTQVKDSGLQPVLPALNTLREMPTGYAQRDEAVPTMMRLGLYQGGKLGAAATDAYYRGLNALLLPRLVLRLEEQLARNLDRPEFLYEGLKVYLMLGGQAPVNLPLVRQWIVLDWESVYPGEDNQGGRAALAQHLDALLERPLQAVALNGPLVEEVRARLANFPLAERAYSLIRQLPAAQRLPEWRVSEHGGPAVTRVFVRPSGKMLSEGVPGIYTYDGFHKVFLPALGDVTAQVGRDAWVLGGDPTATLSPEAAQKLRQDVLSLYLEDYAARWDGLLADLGIVPFQNLQHAMETLNSLGGPSSPLRLVLQGVARETTLATPPPAAATDAAVDAAGDAAAAAAAKVGAGTLVQEADRISQLLGADAGGAPAEPPGKFIDDRFQALHDLVADAGSGSQLDQAISQINQLYGDLQRMAASPNQNELVQTGGAGGAAIMDMATTTTRLPEPVASWLAPVASGVSALRVGGTRTRIDALWKSDVLPLCRQALANRYPFEAGTSDVTLADFTRLFAPGGLIDQFFKTHLLPFVDTSGSSWRNQRVDNVDLGLSAGALAQFQRADKIRNAFFPTGGSVPQVAFELTPQTLSAEATQVLLEVDGQTMTYAHGPARAQPMQWPGQGAGQARVVFTPQQSGSTLSATGPWALFRLLDAAVVQRAAASDRFTVTFTAGGRSAAFEVRAGSVINPFALPELKAFQCPGSL